MGIRFQLQGPLLITVPRGYQKRPHKMRVLSSVFLKKVKLFLIIFSRTKPAGVGAGRNNYAEY
jgi:hypothetical protein